MNIAKIITTLFSATAILTDCNHHPNTENQEIQDDDASYRYVALKDISYTPANIEPGTELEILADLGGRKNVGDTVNYYLFIVTNQKTMDTLLVLCPEITIDEQVTRTVKTSASPLLFNIDKGVTTAYFEPIDTSKVVPFSDDNLNKIFANPDSANIEKLINPQHVVQRVALDKKDTANRVFRFATAIGKLNFKEVPW